MKKKKDRRGSYRKSNKSLIPSVIKGVAKRKHVVRRIKLKNPTVRRIKIEKLKMHLTVCCSGKMQDFMSKEIDARDLRRNNGTISFQSQDMVFPATVTLQWTGPKIKTSSGWSDFPKEFLAEKVQKYLSSNRTYSQGSCFRYADADGERKPYVDTGFYVGFRLRYNGLSFQPNIHQVLAFLKFGETTTNLSTSEHTYVVSHLCGLKDCVGGVPAIEEDPVGTTVYGCVPETHVRLEPQSCNMARKTCDTLHKKNPLYQCVGHVLSIYGVDHYYEPCILPLAPGAVRASWSVLYPWCLVRYPGQEISEW